jgi:potassium-transporting ATPase KdpC subunit
MLVHLRRSILLALIAFVLLGLIYPLVGTGVAQVLFRHQADGSLGSNGSMLIGQNWTSPAYFHGRPDDAGPYAASKTSAGGDNPLVANGHSGGSGGTNLGPRSKVLLANTKELVAYWHSMGVNPTADLVTTSGSGLDPDISPADATAQIPMVAKARHLPASALAALIKRETHGAQFGFLGSDYITVLALNQALVKLK